ncbi:NitT/TauT family transport system ATP-binding protein [Verrucomicrobium sp. GAS474]|uniref:ABC transporter ATP-binding protein n=1 Tax=Verrucomicrobium sp. GAS474 TaxID=1882831 RepID=UPI000879D4DB|nr:ABC transporter ATP-binding protein [Verrucomicrobium sp. GAS474]SDU12409.1 NitT/TauT family transport system ATP-binding protein [Verrucomicrobium sp. GAS474]
MSLTLASAPLPADKAATAAVPTGAIRVEGVAVHFPARGKRPVGTSGRTVAALDGIDLVVPPGQFVALLGPSGCGKSTLLNVLAGFQPPSAGRAVVDGETVREPSARRPVVFQNHSLFPWMTVLENVAFGLRNLKRPHPLDTARRHLALVGLGAYADHYPTQLSGGMQQRVGLARALAIEPPLLLMDEPFGALDAQTRLLMQEQLLSLWESWRHTVVFVTHDIDEAIYLADRVVVLGVRPNAVRGDFAVHLPRPRGFAVRRSDAYLELHEQLFALIREESLKNFGPAEGKTS